MVCEMRKASSSKTNKSHRNGLWVAMKRSLTLSGRVPALNKAWAAARLNSCDGQATLEYLVVAVAFLALVVALGVLWRFATGEGFALIVASSASHSLSVEGVVDALLY